MELILNGEAQAWTDMNILHLRTARLLAEMGYDRRVLPLIEPPKNELFAALAAEIRERQK